MFSMSPECIPNHTCLAAELRRLTFLHQYSGLYLHAAGLGHVNKLSRQDAETFNDIQPPSETSLYLYLDTICACSVYYEVNCACKSTQMWSTVSVDASRYFINTLNVSRGSNTNNFHCINIDKPTAKHICVWCIWPNTCQIQWYCISYL